MNRVIFYTVIASLICFCYACQKDEQPDVESAKKLQKKLENAFQQSSKSELEGFCREWNRSIPFNTTNYIKKDESVEIIYEIFKEFYNPYDLQKIIGFGLVDIENNHYPYGKYIVVQNKINYTIISKENFDKYQDNLKTIKDFRPPLTLANEKILYLIPEYSKAIDKFLGKEMNEDAEKRGSFLSNSIPIIHGHWSGWHIETHPEVDRIYLDTDRTTAKVFFRVAHRGGEAILEKKANGWEIVESYATWIE
jgi:hypothetical protein